MAILGKVAGTMLKDNLVRNGVDLQIDSNLMYYDVANRRVGVNTTLPGNSFTVNGSFTTSNIYIDGNIISSLDGNLILTAVNGNIDANSKNISNVADPILNQDVATKAYVDNFANVALSANLVFTDGANTSQIDIIAETLTFNGTANQINSIVGNNSVTFSLTDNVSLIGNLTAGNLITDGNILFSNNRPFSVLTVSEINDANVLSNVVTAVHTIRTNRDTGLFVNDFGSGEVVLSLGSSFKTWVFQGQPNLVAYGEDTIEVIAGNAIAFTTDNTATPYKSWQIDFTGNTSNPIIITNTDVSTDSITGALIVSGGAGITGDVNVNGFINANGFIYSTSGFQGNLTGYFDGIVGNNTPNLGIFTDIDTTTANIANFYFDNNTISPQDLNGNIILAPSGNGYVDINSSSALGLPVGSNLTRPDYADEGMLRFNTNIDALEFFDGSQWIPIGSTVLTTVISDQFTGDNTTTQFTLSQTSTTSGVIVTINGVIQIPSISYNVFGTTLEFAEAPVSTDIIEARIIVTTSVATSLVAGNSVVEFGSAANNFPLLITINNNLIAEFSTANTTIFNTLIASGNVDVIGNLSANAIYTDNYYFANGVSFLSSTYSNSNVAAYLLGSITVGNINSSNGFFWANGTAYSTGSGSTYSNSNVAAYLIANPQTGTYSNSNVASYLTANPQTGTYSNSNVASYLTANPQTGTYSNSNVAAYLPTYAGNLSSLNINLTGNLSGNTAGYTLGYLDVPQNAQNSDYVLSLTDRGKHIYSTSASNQNIYIPTNANVAFPIGTAVNFVLQGTGNIFVTANSGVTMYLAGNSTSSTTRTISSFGLGTLQKVATDTWFVVGVGIT